MHNVPMDKTRLLIVDDEKKLRDLLTAYLSKEGFQVAAVGDGMEMDVYLTNHEVDLVILDLMMPDISGLDVLKTIKQDPLHRHIPIIMVGDYQQKMNGKNQNRLCILF